MVGLLLIVGAIALGVVCLHSEEARTARRIQRMQVERVTIRRELWSVQLTIARYKTPQRIGGEVHRCTLAVTAPDAPRPDQADDVRCVTAR